MTSFAGRKKTWPGGDGTKSAPLYRNAAKYTANAGSWLVWLFTKTPLADKIVLAALLAAGCAPTVPVTTAKALNVTMQVDSHAGMKIAVRPDPGLKAPVHVGQKVGMLVVTAPEFPNLTVPVYATQAVSEVGMFGKMWNSAQHLWKK